MTYFCPKYIPYTDLKLWLVLVFRYLKLITAGQNISTSKIKNNYLCVTGCKCQLTRTIIKLQWFYPNATSRAIITMKPTMYHPEASLLLPPVCASGIMSSITTNNMAPAAKARA